MDAMRAYTEAFRGKKVSAKRLLRAIEGLLMLDDIDRAQKLVSRADEMFSSLLQPETIKLYRLKGEIAMRLQQSEQAMKYCRDVLEIDPLAGETLLLLAEILHQGGEVEEAVMNCERAARIPGFEVDALIRHAQIEVGRERYTAAVTLLEAAQTFKDQPHVGRYLEQLRRMVR